jgi:hypothetical protein
MKTEARGAVSFLVTDLWELGERILTGEIVHSLPQPDERLLVRLDAPVDHGGKTYLFLLVSPRHEGHDLARIELGESVPSNALGLVARTKIDRIAEEESAWRGGELALIGSLSRA